MSLVEDNAIILSAIHTDHLLTTLFLGGEGIAQVMTEVCFAQVTKDVSPQGQECLTTVEEVYNKSNKGGVQ